MYKLGKLFALVKLALVVGVGASLLSAAVAVQAEDIPRKEFKVCKDPNNLPFSNEANEGLENKLAELFAKKLNLPLTYYSFPQRFAFVRNTLNYKLPNQDFRCDIMMGVPVGYDQVSATQPYYRSTYTLVIPAGIGLDNVNTVADFLALPKEQLAKLRIGVPDRSPAADWLNKYNLLENAFPYKVLDADPEQYAGQLIDKELANGKYDIVLAWGPISGYFAKQVKSKTLKVIPMESEKNIKLDYEMAMGVRYREPEWKKQINDLIAQSKPEIDAILLSYGVPLLPLEHKTGESK